MSNNTQWRIRHPRTGEAAGVEVYAGDQFICQMTHHPDQSQAAKDNASRIVACMNACEGYSTEQLESLAGGNVKREVTLYADKLCGAENRYLKAELSRDQLLAALEALLEHEGTVDVTGIGDLPSDALQTALNQAQAVIAAVKADR
jgi:hypothetical protein